MITTKSTQNTKTTRLVFLCDPCVLCGKRLNCCLGQRNSTQLLARPLRRGISLIEVMVSMLVALIGVFGVFALIAFAVRQVEIGMNEEAAQTLARNAMSDFEAQGFQDMASWANPDITMALPPSYTPIAAPTAPLPPATISRQFFCIDPWGWSQFGLTSPPVLDPFTDLTVQEKLFGVFPYFVPAAATPYPTIPRISLFDNANTVFSKALARRMFAGHDDLVTTAPTDDFSGPTQQFFAPNGGRQYSGRLSWQMFVAQDFETEGYARFYSAVSLTRTPDNQNRVFTVTIPASRSFAGGGDVALTEIPRNPTPDSTLIRRGTWMILIEQSGAGAIDDIAFCRVLESEETSAGMFSVTLQGSDLILQPIPLPPLLPSTVHAVLLPDVIAVYERTMKFETSSDWNAN